jgi:hypothetical protein
MLIACKLAYLETYSDPPAITADGTQPTERTEPAVGTESTELAASTESRQRAVGTGSNRSITPNPLSRRRPLTIYPGMDLSVEVEDRRVAFQSGYRRLRIAGRADWAFGHGERNNSDTGIVLIAVEAKSPKTFGQAQHQLLTYLAIMRKLRQQEKKQNDYVQGFYSDGRRYCFICISPDGRVMESSTYDIRFPEQLKFAFNWIVDMLISAAKSSPSTSPTKLGKQRDGELEDLGSQVFLRLYRPNDDEDLEVEVDLDVTEMEIDELN